MNSGFQFNEALAAVTVDSCLRNFC